MRHQVSRRSFIIGGASALVAGGALAAVGTSSVARADSHKMKNAQWIWIDEDNFTIDEYGEFYSKFNYDSGAGPAVLEVACDGIYAAFVNGKLAYFAQCSDFPDYKLYDKFDISSFCHDGQDNELKIQVWFAPGQGCSTYKDTNTPGVIFEVYQGSTVCAFSSMNTLSRKMNEYWCNRHESISPQMGFNFWTGLDAKPCDYNPKSKASTITGNLHEREILPLELQEPVESKLIAVYDNISEGADQIAYVYELPQETVGFLDFKIKCNVAPGEGGAPGKETIKFTWGEHIVDGGRPRYSIRNFTSYVVCVDGENSYTNPFRRIGAKYLQIICKKGVLVDPDKAPYYVSLRPVMYPLQEKAYTAKDAELQQIYDASILTLCNCMHEHYEDCPWREQALYGMDSRNQMLCGYYVFEGHEYQRHNLILLAHSLRKDGILDICAPCTTDRPIPFFSLCFILGVYEYIQHTNDTSILKHVNFAVDAIFKACKEKFTPELNLITTWKPDGPYWNFYEWAEASDGGTQDAHLIMNAMFCYVHDLWKTISKKTYLDTDVIRENIKKYFYKNGKYVLHSDTAKDSQLGNSILLLAGVWDDDLQKKLADDLIASREMKGEMIKATLSMKAFVYDALIKNNSQGKNYADVVLDDIRFCFMKMIKDKTFTGTFWETEEGQSAFSNAGSLCHGWSAIPAYYLPKYFS